MIPKGHLFVCGCPRSGTSALTNWLHASNTFAIGMERYQGYWQRNLRLPEDAFTEERFFDVHPDDTWYESLNQFPALYDHLQSGWSNARYVGDKIPELWEDLSGLTKSYPNSKIFYTYRDPFTIALSYKMRGKATADRTWAAHKDITFGVLEFNKSARKIVDFLNSVSEHAHPSSDRCFIVEYEKFITNAIDRRALAAFLDVSEPLPIISDNVTGRGPIAETDRLSEIEKDLVWSLLDLSTVAEIRQIVSRQSVKLGRRTSRSNRLGRQEWYHSEDKKLADIDYGEFRIDNCTYVFRGRKAQIDVNYSYAVCLGSATTFGRFLRRPYPSQLEDALGIPFVNLGIGGARPEAYLVNNALMDFVRQSNLVVIELMSARGYHFPLFAPNAFEGNMGRFMDAFNWEKHRNQDQKLDWILKKAERNEPVFIDRAYEIGFKYLTTDQRNIIRDSIISQYLRDTLLLAKEAGKPVVGLLITRTPHVAARMSTDPKDYTEWSGEYPHFVDALAVEALEQHGIPVVVSRSSRGFPFTVRNWETGQPASVFSWQKDPALNTYYPSQEMHDDASRLLLDSDPIMAWRTLKTR